MRDFKWDKLKNQNQLRKELGKTCTIEGCMNPLTHMQGPGKDSCCRDHQLNLVEWGGTGKMSRPHTMHREYYCEECGYNPFEDTANKYYYLKESDPELWNRICRNKLIGDHQIRVADGGDNTKENIKTLCINCNADKTMINKDWRKPDKKVLLDEDNNVIED